jgi:non-specific serine/threonine protein kinase/serine/threonine-protein kinase
MTARWDRIKEIAGEALEIDRASRAAFLLDACGGDAELHAEILTLLGAEDPGRFLEPDRPPDRIGAYRIVREIGRGGMGTVYEGARADAQFEQRAAIKIVKRGMDTDAVLRRFYAERQILARLQHPHIGRLFDGGVTDDGRPYFVMEYLEAQPITTYCDEHRLNASARIELFILVCDAVEYAHSRFVLHRDLKPANIVVDASGTPKLLDFGIAKLLDRDDPTGLVTEVAQHAMTPAYASPEQRRGEVLTTASDVYALGLILQELVPASDRRGDLERIVRKALEDDEGRRYQRAGALAEDLRRYRANQPVSARPSGPAYRASKYIARHWRGLSVTAVAVVIVTVAVANAVVQGRRAERHFKEVRQLANSFLFEFHDAIARLPGATPARELVLTRAVQYLDALSREATSDVDLKRELAESYQRVAAAQGLVYEANLGKETDAQRNYEKAVALFRDVAVARPSDPGAKVDLASAMIDLSSVLNSTDPPRRRALLDEAAVRLRDLSDPRARMVLANAYTGLAEVTTADPAQSLTNRNKAIAIYAALSKQTPPYPDSERVYSISLKRRGVLYYSGMHDAATSIVDLNTAKAIDERRIAADPASAVARLDLAIGESYRSVVLRQLGQFPEAVDALERCLAIRRDLFQADPQNVRNRQLLAADVAKVPTLVAALEKAGAPEALQKRAAALTTAH